MRTRLLWRAFLLLGAAWLTPLPLASQNLLQSRHSSFQTYVFQLTNEEARTLYDKGPYALGEEVFHTLVDSFPTDEAYQRKLPTGHYLFAYAENAALRLTFQSVDPVELGVLNNRHQLQLIILDTLGQAVKDAEVHIRSKPVPFDPQAQCYLHPRFERSGLVAVKQGEHISFFQLEGKNPNGISARRVVNWVLYLPVIKQLSWPFRAIFQSIRYRSFSPLYQPFVYRFNQWFSPREHKAYAAFNQPIFRPHDSLLCRAVILSHKGKPYDRPLKAFIRNRNNKRIDLPVRHPEKGVYLIETALSDTMELQLDRYQTLLFESPKGRIVYRSGFRLEDYELSQTYYSLRADTSTYFTGEPIRLWLKGTDESERNLLDARVQLYLLTDQAQSVRWYAAQGHLPDTLWQHAQALDPVGETLVLLPDSLFPGARFTMNVKAVFLNASQERKEHLLRLDYRHREADLTIVDQQDSLWLDWRVGGQSVPQTIYYQRTGEYRLRTDSLMLPAKIAWQPWIDQIRFFRPGFEKWYRLHEDKVQVFGRHSGDSLFVKVFNPRKLDLWYTLFQVNQVVEQGQGQELNWKRKAQSEQSYFLSLHYLWNGRVIDKNVGFAYQPNDLNISIEHPAQVQPGAKLPVEVSVLDQQGKPVPHTSLGLYAWTARFPGSGPPQVPRFPEPRKGRKARTDFALENISYQRQHSDRLDYPRWNPAMGLDSIEWYRFRYPGRNIYRHQFDIDSPQPQFGIYVFDRGLAENIHLIQVDEIPLYYSGQWGQLPFSLPVDSGYHQIRLRLADMILELDSVLLEPGQKTILSLDKTQVPPEVHWRLAEPEWTSSEAALLNRYFVRMHIPANQDFLLRQWDRTYHFPRSSGGRKQTVLGPFWGRQEIEVASRDGWAYHIPYEAGYEYDFFPHYARLRSQQLVNAGTPLRSTYWELHSLNDLRLTYEQVREKWNIPEPSWTFIRQDRVRFINPTRTQRGYGRLRIEVPPNERLADYILLEKLEDSTLIRAYAGYERLFHRLEKGPYRVHLLLRGKPARALVSAPISVEVNGLNFTRLDSLPSVRLTDSLSRWYQQRLSQALDLSIQTLAPSQPTQAAIGKKDESANWAYEVEGVIKHQGEALAGAVVLVEGTSTGVITDAFGRFRLKVPNPDAKLRVMFVGMVSQELTADWVGEREIELEEDFQTTLDEVVVVGYGMEREAKAVGAISVEATSDVPVSIRGQASGVVIGQEKIPAPQLDADPPIELSEEEIILPLAQDSGSLRTDFRDYAFWVPNLYTDAEGKAQVELKVPDDITRWRVFALGHNDQKQSGQAESSLTTFRSLAAKLDLPRFLLPGDSARIIGKSLNYQGDTVLVESRFEQDEKILYQRQHALVNVALDTVVLVAPDLAGDSLALQYSLIRLADQYLDGEKRDLPLYALGSPETSGEFWSLQQDTILSFQADSNLGPVYLSARSDLLEVFWREIQRLDDYHYLCNEQAASKLKALLLQKKLTAQLGMPFLGEAKIKRMIRRLQRAQGEEGGWGWWPNGKVQMWVSLHVTEALLEAKAAGYAVNFRQTLLKDWLIFELERQTLLDQLRALQILTLLEAKVNYGDHLARLDSVVQNHPRYLAEAIALKQKHGLAYELDTLLAMQNQTLFGNVYWGEESYRVTDNAFLSTLAVYEVLKRVEGQEKRLQKMRAYLLERRSTGWWRNTYESALALAILVPEYLDQQGNSPGAGLGVNGVAIENFPYADTLAAGAKIEIQKQGNSPVYFTAYQSWWEKRPQEKQAPFVVNSWFEDEKGDSLAVLKAGEKVRLKVEVELPDRAEYVMVRIPIPGACSYDRKPFWKPGESYREYYRDHVAIFAQILSKGQHTYTLDLVPRFSGQYTLNPAQVEMMYFPVFMGREESKRLRIR
jgi:hypothetical protein